MIKKITQWASLVAFVLLSIRPITSLATADTDFAARCTAAGVTLCEGFDNNTDLNRNDGSTVQNGYQDGCNGQQGFIDSNVFVSGGGSLRFKMLQGAPVGCKDIAGKWDAGLGASYTPNASPNQHDLYVAYAYRISSSLLSMARTKWGSSLKLTDIYGHHSTCQSDEWTVTIDPIANSALFGRPTWYVNCGNGWTTDTTTGNVQNPDSSINACSSDCNFEQGSGPNNGTNVGFNCHYQTPTTGDGNGNGCFIQLPDQWYVMEYHLKLCTIGEACSSVESWVITPDGRKLQWQKNINVIWPTGGFDGLLDRIYLSPYMTQLPSGSPSTLDTYIWYDELIISTLPIADPSYTQPAQVTGTTAH